MNQQIHIRNFAFVMILICLQGKNSSIFSPIVARMVTKNYGIVFLAESVNCICKALAPAIVRSNKDSDTHRFYSRKFIFCSVGGDFSCKGQLPYPKVQTVPALKIYMYRSASVFQSHCGKDLVQFNFTEVGIGLVLHHGNVHAHHAHIIRNSPPVNHLRHKGADISLLSCSCYGDYWKFSVISFGKGWKIISAGSRLSACDNYRLT